MQNTVGSIWVSRAAVVMTLLSLALLSNRNAAQLAESGLVHAEHVLVRPADRTTMAMFDGIGVLRHRSVDIDAAVLKSMQHGTRVTLKMFDDVSLSAVIERSWRSRPDTWHWQGRVEGHPHSSILAAAVDDALTMMIRVPGVGDFRVLSYGPNGPVAEQVDAERFPPCGCGPEHAVHKPAGRPTPVAIGRGDDDPDCGRIIDVMIVYTPEARMQVAPPDDPDNDAPIRSMAELVIMETNLGFENSLIEPRVRLVHAAEVDYVESGSFITELDRLTLPDDGYMDEVHQWRDEYGADLVAMLISHTQGNTICGIAWMMSSPATVDFESNAFSVNSTICIAGMTRVVPHELGHNMGCNHDLDNAGGIPAHDFAYGHRFFGSDAQQYRTIMSYAPGIRIDHYSNPDVLFVDTPTGIPDAIDNARSINLVQDIVSNFRPSVVMNNEGWVTGSPLVPPGLMEGDQFGTSIALDGNLLIVGASEVDRPGNIPNVGAAYIFRFDPETQQWVYEATLQASDGQANDRFGIDVAILEREEGSTAVVGAYLHDTGGTDSGAVYVFRHTGSVWIEEAKLRGNDTAAGDLFGRSVAITEASGVEYILAGAYLDDDSGASSGSAYVFRRIGSTWSQHAKLRANDGAANDHFGVTVAMIMHAEDQLPIALVGAWWHDHGDTNAGAAYVFRLNGVGAWTQQAKLTANDPVANANFGISLAMNNTSEGPVALIGAWRAGGVEADTGAAYLFRQVGESWNLETKLTADDGAAGDRFGIAVAINENLAIVGDHINDEAEINAGAAYAFHRDKGQWVSAGKILPSVPELEGQFGSTVAVYAGHVAIGAWNDDYAVIDGGAVYFPVPGAPAADCNMNGVPDECDILFGDSEDLNFNGIPDECELVCVGDVAPPGGDGVVNSDDLLLIIGSWGACPAKGDCPADIAPPGGDGLVNTDDLLLIIANWGACPTI